jgi:adenylate cyclase
LARLLDRIGAARPKVIAFDLLFTEPQPPPQAIGEIAAAMAPLRQSLDRAAQRRLDDILSGLARGSDPDASLGEAIGRAGNVIVPFTLDLVRGAVRNATLPPELARAAYDRVRGTGPDHLPAAAAVHLPVGALAKNARLAHVTMVPDRADGYRYDYPVLRYADAYLPSLSLETARIFLGVTKSQVVVDIGPGVDLGALEVPTDRGMRLLVNYYSPGGFERVSFADALDGRVAPRIFAGKIVLIGASASGLGDSVATPYQPAMSGVERHATLIANLVDGDFLRRDGGAVAIDAAFILLGGMGVGWMAGWGIAAAAAGALLLVAGLAVADDLAFVRFGLWLNFLFPASAIVLTGAVLAGGRYVAEWRRQRFVRDAFSRYLHADLVDELCRTRAPLQLGGEERALTVLFADLRDFTSVAETLSARELTALVNEFFGAMTDQVLLHRGMLDKFIGDSLMAVFGAPLPDREHALNACRAALDMRRTLPALHARWRAAGRPCLEMRIGINTGPMVIGNMGTQRRFDYTVMGDEVNVASRLEGANKELGSEILISASTMAAAGAGIVARPRGRIAVKGRKQSVEVFELLAVAGATDREITAKRCS